MDRSPFNKDYTTLVGILFRIISAVLFHPSLVFITKSTFYVTDDKLNLRHFTCNTEVIFKEGFYNKK